MGIVVEGLGKVYRDTVAVESLSFEVPSGTVLGLLGPNGAGKTSTLRCLAGIIPPTRGSLRIDDADVVRAPVEAKRRTAFIPDEPAFFDQLTVWEHLRFTAAAYRIAAFEQPARHLLERFELADRRDTLASELSRGMRQKLAVCCAYLHEPTALLLDEPMTGLDPQGIQTLRASLQERAAAGTAVIVSSHLLSMLEGVCSQILILQRGRCLFHGDLVQMRERYPELGDTASLEALFLHATGQAG